MWLHLEWVRTSDVCVFIPYLWLEACDARQKTNSDISLHNGPGHHRRLLGSIRQLLAELVRVRWQIVRRYLASRTEFGNKKTHSIQLCRRDNLATYTSLCNGLCVLNSWWKRRTEWITTFNSRRPTSIARRTAAKVTWHAPTVSLKRSRHNLTHRKTWYTDIQAATQSPRHSSLRVSLSGQINFTHWRHNVVWLNFSISLTSN